MRGRRRLGAPAHRLIFRAQGADLAPGGTDYGGGAPALMSRPHLPAFGVEAGVESECKMAKRRGAF